ncbi:bile acid:sodium symporter [Nitzschia inconspicua]|uniref:Bile acid:sodium symporter n=1 Tax=Nitzschia inconspicua TaxID=303405 RepID=A0A9K3Q4D2_9STRA|nr:bile acid:sodium symporter [Nitzschia inconspicua]
MKFTARMCRNEVIPVMVISLTTIVRISFEGVQSFVPASPRVRLGPVIGIDDRFLMNSFQIQNSLDKASSTMPLPLRPSGRDWSTSKSISTNNSSSNQSTTLSTNKLDQTLASLTSAFPFFVLGSAILALLKPSSLLWTNKGDLITIMLASVMWGTGLTLTKDDFTVVLQQNWAAVPSGVLCQFLIMPLSALLLGRTILLPSQPYGSALFLGLSLVGCSPGGTASNLVSLIAKADVALSVLLTSCSTILASVATPLLVKLLVGSTIAVSGWTLCTATARVVLLPVLLGMIVNARAPTLASAISRFTPFCSVVLVALICGGVVAENAALLLSTSAGLLPRIVSAVLGLHCLGFLAGYLVPKLGLRFSEKTSRTISIETGMQNSALAVVLARSIGAPPIASLPGALSATVHSCLGSILAAYWRGVDSGRNDNAIKSMDQSPKDSPDDYPELLI